MRLPTLSCAKATLLLVYTSCSIVLLVALVLASLASVAASSSLSPVIAILSQPLRDSNNTYIAASYVKWLEVGGARSIAIPFDADLQLVQDILGQVDGVLFPGGGAPVPDSAKHIWKLLHIDYYPNDDRIPVWGTCLGMEFLVQLASNNFEDALDDGYDTSNVSLPLLQVERDGLYESDYIYEIVTGNNVTFHYHHMGISPAAFRSNDALAALWKITATNNDLKGKPFVSTMEPFDKINNPIYGVQFHPEKNAFEYGLYPDTTIPYEDINHSTEAIALSLHMANFFVGLAKDNILNRANNRQVQFFDPKYTKINRYPMVYTYPRKVGVQFEERYIIPPAASWRQQIDDVASVQSGLEQIQRHPSALRKMSIS